MDLVHALLRIPLCNTVVVFTPDEAGEPYDWDHPIEIVEIEDLRGGITVKYKYLPSLQLSNGAKVLCAEEPSGDILDWSIYPNSFTVSEVLYRKRSILHPFPRVVLCVNS